MVLWTPFVSYNHSINTTCYTHLSIFFKWWSNKISLAITFTLLCSILISQISWDLNIHFFFIRQNRLMLWLENMTCTVIKYVICRIKASIIHHYMVATPSPKSTYELGHFETFNMVKQLVGKSNAFIWISGEEGIVYECSIVTICLWIPLQVIKM